MIAAIVQARMGSSRLPGKVLMNIGDQPLLWHVIRRVRAAKSIDQIIVATTENTADAPLREFLDGLNIPTVCGSEIDVLDRFYQAAKQFKADVIVRITPDDPFKDPEIIDHAVQLITAATSAVDYVSNCSYDGSIPSTYPEGLDIEVLTFPCLEKMWKEAKLPSEREHLTPYLFNHADRFNILGFQHTTDLSDLRWTIDYEKDLAFAREVYKRLYPVNPLFLMNDILKLLKANPQLCQINAGVVRYEGYRRSVAAERQTSRIGT